MASARQPLKIAFRACGTIDAIQHRSDTQLVGLPYTPFPDAALEVIIAAEGRTQRHGNALKHYNTLWVGHRTSRHRSDRYVLSDLGAHVLDVHMAPGSALPDRVVDALNTHHNDITAATICIVTATTVTLHTADALAPPSTRHEQAAASIGDILNALTVEDAATIIAWVAAAAEQHADERLDAHHWDD